MIVSESNCQDRDDVEELPSSVHEASVTPKNVGSKKHKVLAFVLKKGKTFKKILTLKTSDLDDQELIRLILAEVHKKQAAEPARQEDDVLDIYSTSQDTRGYEGQHCGSQDKKTLTPNRKEYMGSNLSLNQATSHQYQVQSKCCHSSAAVFKMSEEEEDINQRIYNQCAGGQLENIGSFQERDHNGRDFSDVEVTAPEGDSIQCGSFSNKSYTNMLQNDRECIDGNIRQHMFDETDHDQLNVSQENKDTVNKVESNYSYKKETSAMHILQYDTFDEREVRDGNCYDYFDITRLRRGLTANYLPTEYSSKCNCDNTPIVDAIADSTFMLSDFLCD